STPRRYAFLREPRLPICAPAQVGLITARSLALRISSKTWGFVCPARPSVTTRCGKFWPAVMTRTSESPVPGWPVCVLPDNDADYDLGSPVPEKKANVGLHLQDAEEIIDFIRQCAL